MHVKHVIELFWAALFGAVCVYVGFFWHTRRLVARAVIDVDFYVDDACNTDALLYVTNMTDQPVECGVQLWSEGGWVSVCPTNYRGWYGFEEKVLIHAHQPSVLRLPMKPAGRHAVRVVCRGRTYLVKERK